MQGLWIQNISITMGLVDTVSIPTLLKMVASGKIPSEKAIAWAADGDDELEEEVQRVEDLGPEGDWRRAGPLLG
jgi:hypothetical protein